MRLYVDGFARQEFDIAILVYDEQPGTFVEGVGSGIVSSIHFQELPMNGQLEPESLNPVRNAGLEPQSTVVITQAGEAIHKHHPHTAMEAM